MLRLHQAENVVELLGPILATFVGVDEVCTARMLHAIAVTRSVSIERGLALLCDLNTASIALHAHRVIRAEISYWTAFAHWMKRDYRATLEFALVAEAARADVVSVRAATLRGFVALAKERYEEALLLFRSALDKYDACKERDADLQDRILVQISSLEVALRSATIAGTHFEAIEHPYASSNEFRMVTEAMNAWLYAFDGELKPAYRRARIAENLAPSAAWGCWALANRAQIAAAFGDDDIAAEFAAEALEIAERTHWNEISDEARVALLLLAEVLATTDPLSAVLVLQRYDELTTEIDRALLFHDDVRLWILETFVRGLVHRIRGHYADAREAFESVHAAADRVGIKWRAALSLIELDATPAQGRERLGIAYGEMAKEIVDEHFPRSFLARRMRGWPRACRDSLPARLSPTQSRVIRHVLEAKTQKEIATAMGLSSGTVHNHITSLLKAFDVHSTAELIVQCYNRGIGSPAWWIDYSEGARPPSGRVPETTPAKWAVSPSTLATARRR